MHLPSQYREVPQDSPGHVNRIKTIKKDQKITLNQFFLVRKTTTLTTSARTPPSLFRIERRITKQIKNIAQETP